MRAVVTTLLTILLAVGCGSDGPTGPETPGPANGTMSARIDGTQWTASTITPGITGGISAIGGSDGTRTLAFAWVEAGTGTYQIGTAVGFNGNLTIAGGIWVANGSAGDGTLVVTTRTSDRIAGTFSFVMTAGSGGASGTRTVSQGTFDITF